MFVYKCSWLNAQIKFDIDFFVFWAIWKFFLNNSCLLLLQMALFSDFKALSGAEGAVNASREL